MRGALGWNRRDGAGEDHGDWDDRDEAGEAEAQAEAEQEEEERRYGAQAARNDYARFDPRLLLRPARPLSPPPPLAHAHAHPLPPYPHLNALQHLPLVGVRPDPISYPRWGNAQVHAQIHDGWGRPNVRIGKKYGVRMSHSRRVERGFTRDVIEPIESSPPSTLLSVSIPLTTAPIPDMQIILPVPLCASCLAPLLLDRSGKDRLWALACGHVVCGNCAQGARVRWKGGWTGVHAAKDEGTGRGAKDGKGKGKGKGRRESSELGSIDLTNEASSPPPPSSRLIPSSISSHSPSTSTLNKSKGKGKGIALDNVKGKASPRGKEAEALVNPAWIECPIVSCEGGTIWSGKAKKSERAIELFV